MNSVCAKELAIQWFERVWQQRSKEAIFELMSEEAIGHPEGGQIIKGPAEFAKMHDFFLSAFTDFALKILHVVGDETQACVHWQVCGTHTGPFGPLTATQEPVCFTGMTYLIVESGKIVEGWDCWDQGALTGLLAAKCAAMAQAVC